MDRPDCLSLSYSAGRLCYEDSKQMRSLHLLPRHASQRKKKKHFKHSDGYLNIFSINHKGFLLKPCNRLCAHDEGCCSLLCCGAKAAHAQVSMRASLWCPGQTRGTTSSPSWAQGDPGPCPKKDRQAAALAPGIYYQLNVQR